MDNKINPTDYPRQAIITLRRGEKMKPKKEEEKSKPSSSACHRQIWGFGLLTYELLKQQNYNKLRCLQ